MGKGTVQYYLLDNLTKQNAAVLQNSLKIVPDITSAVADVPKGLLQVQARKGVEEQVKLACEVAGILFRTKISKRDFR
ncbi:MAG: hypothetical protein ACLFRY_10050 [Spirochaetia bacterium]